MNKKTAEVLKDDDPGSRAFTRFRRPHPGAFSQLMCPHPREFAHFFKKNANAGGGGGGRHGRVRTGHGKPGKSCNL